MKLLRGVGVNGEATMRCGRCHEFKQRDQFTGLGWSKTRRCRACAAEYSKQWKAKNHERITAQRHVRERAIQSDPIRLAEHNKRKRQRRHEMKLRVFHVLGGSCVCCGERHPCFLQIDHTENDGAVRRRLASGVSRNDPSAAKWGEIYQRRLYKSILDGKAVGLQLLCANCNWGKARNHGACPHEAQR